MGAPRPGTLFAVVGPSGVGKDAVIGFARDAFAADERIVIVRRVISRPADGASEDHLAVTTARFSAMGQAGAFAVTWTAHGLQYGLPAAAADHVAAGGIAIANGSRQALGRIRAAFGEVQIVRIAAAPDVLAARLAARGRETEAQIAERLRRSVEADHGLPEAVTIDNSGPIDVAGRAFVRLVRRRLASAGPVPATLTNPG